ncbi:MAG: SusC/RagA family TonB-linked outer membrane protein [Pedobacter sp.]|uniref:SusC/RagA family TonB-linked outer membrane protein n=1 Tax=Pedobacter sp. TaxID=1411316 RepID=UPI00356835B3
MNFNDLKWSVSLLFGRGWPVAGEGFPGLSGRGSGRIRGVIMRLNLIIFFLTAMLMQVSAISTAQITLTEHKAPLLAVIKSLKKQSGYHFFYNDQNLKEAKPVTVSLKNVSLEEALKACMEGQELTYKIEQKMVVIKQKPKSLLDKVMGRFLLMDVKGVVRDEKGEALAGATVRVKGTEKVVMTGSKGEFVLVGVEENAVLVISYLGFESRELKAQKDMGDIGMVLVSGKLDEVSVMASTGYQSLPKERATGSFSQVDNNLLNRTVSTNVMDRLADVVPGLIFNKGVGGAQGLVIRGQTSINPETSRPLIIVDNFPYENDINNINPNDVENITILKDAAAASIWGARAGNGVIVITTKQGKYNQKPQLTFNTTFTTGERPDLFYQPKVSTSDFIDNEIRLFDLNVYKPAELNQSLLQYPLTPVVELLIKKRDNPALASGIDATIDSWRNYDVRNDIEKYFYRPLSRQQYNLQLQGGNDQNRYLISIGYDKNKNSEVGNGLDRLTVNANNTYAFIKEKLELQTNLYYTNTKNENNFEFPYYTIHQGYRGNFLYPYARFADDEGNASATVGTYRQGFIDDMESKGFLDWQYRPLDEIKNADKSILTKEYRFNTALRYKIIPGLNAEIRYQYGNSNGLNRSHYSEETFFTRNLINYYSTINTTNNSVNRTIPIGGILNTDRGTINSHNFRTQVNYDKVFGKLHEVNALAGYEISSQKTNTQLTRLYGFDDQYATSVPVNYNTLYSISIYPSASYQFRVPNVDRIQELTSRFVSWYGNVGYWYDKRYLLNASLRFDQSNIFGVRTNQRGVPLYSIGAGWQINEEDFYRVDWLEQLKLRATWGRSGNVNRSLTSLTTINYSSAVDPLTGLQYASVGQAPNPNLRWEKINNLNFGLDFSMLNNRINGSLDWYKKWGYDIFSTIPYAEQAGINQFTGNYSDTEAKGIDLNLQSHNLTGAVKWTTDFQLSFVTDKVTKAKFLSTTNGFTILTDGIGTGTYPYEGKPLYSVYGYKWGGLDPTNGDPMGYLNGEVSKDWAGIANDIRRNPENLIYFGTARPKYYGAIRNTISTKNISISANISYRLGYFIRRNAIDYSNVNLGGWEHADLSLAWNKPGDELVTDIPSIDQLPTNTSRSGFYQLSENQIKKGDHIRLNDVSLSYTFSKTKIKSLPFQQIRFFGIASNLGILWKASNSFEDPDYYQSIFIPVRIYSIGVSANL